MIGRRGALIRRGRAVRERARSLVEVVEAEFGLEADRRARTLTSRPSAASSRRPPLRAPRAARGPSARVAGALRLAGLPTLFSVSRTDHPPRRLAREAAAGVVALAREDRAAVTLAELAGLSSSSASSGRSSSRIRFETAARLRPRRPREILFREAQVLDQRRAGPRLVDRVEVLAGHVLDQRRLKPPGSSCVADDRGDLLQPGLLGGPPAPLAGDQLVASVGSGRTISGCTIPLASIESARAAMVSGSNLVRG